MEEHGRRLQRKLKNNSYLCIITKFNKMKNLKKTELEKLQNLNSDFVNLKTQLGDLELQKHLVIEKVQFVRSEFAKMEKELVDKYGEDTTINLQTGEIKEKEKE